VRDKDLRGRDRLFMAESELVLRRLLRAPERLHSVLLSPARHRELEPALSALPADIPVFVADVDLMTRIAGFHIHRGVLAAGWRPKPADLAMDTVLAEWRGGGPCRLVVAEGLTNVDNMGGLFRNAAAFDVDAVVLDPACCDPLYRKAIRVSMGHVLSTPYAVAASWPDDLERLKREWNVTLVGAEVSPTACPLWELRPLERVAVLFGSERHGLGAGALEACDTVVRIPMAPGVPSINVAAASAVVLYELGRAR
jgi:tRNA G18 (ribose-2'-O)-methylase SpoU